LFPQGYTKEAAALASSLTICPSVKHAHRIFLAHFLTSVYDLIPGRDLALRQLVIQVEAVQMAAMALAAANLANVEGAYAYSANRTRQSWIPKKTYVDESLNFANQVSSLTDGSLLDSKAAIAIRLLLAYRELEVGTIRNLILQTVAIERALINMNEDLATNPEDVWIWRATINIRALLRATIGPFQRVDSETLHQRAITSLDAHFSTDPHLIHYLVASAIHISTRIILSRTLGEDCKDPEKLARKISEWHAIMLGMGNLPDMRTPDADMDMHLTEDRLFEHLELLEEQARLYRPGVSDFLEDLLPYLTQDDPIEVLDNVDYMSIEPLELGDHETTMTAALYIFAQIICSSTLLRNMLDGAESQFSGARWNPTDHDRSRPWLHLLLRVARALAFRPADLPRRNTYRRGITPMLFFAAVRYRDVRILNFLDNFLADMDRAGVAWEDIQSPVSLIRLTIGIVQQEIGAGRTIFKVGSTFAYTRSLKDMVVTDTDELLVLHGRNEHGKYFNKAVPFKMGKRGNGLDFDSALGFAEPVL
jgi:roadblock/LC7 domain-containing protein